MEEMMMGVDNLTNQIQSKNNNNMFQVCQNNEVNSV